ncbi:VOC family protein [Nocardia seriolae]|uniref:Glyoxalase n=1 Tax=Nocardia seriolae TaxID=37332 RepID=A0A0B8NF86_9NOCA|nr:VOC family protein [Nocardia seriolae]APA94331.1 Lactoylglutathione lyase [Nocardia seriolae]MTJ60452.1 glyoxalase [Nocardia seriolae]MTJ72496.1 glyoxalase [Nocardia seriolae]MTJ84660.1 glyoxalase [Nocardia seriolae]MTK28648.1 glyoxalase [Nocardia seriolae]
MNITASVISLNVPDPIASAKFLVDHFGFTEKMSADGFVNVTRDDAGFDVVYLRTGLGSFKPERIAGSAGEGLLVAFVVDDIDAEYDRVRNEGVPIVTPIETEPWGERYFQALDPNGIVIQLVQWV